MTILPPGAPGSDWKRTAIRRVFEHNRVHELDLDRIQLEVLVVVLDEEPAAIRAVYVAYSKGA